MNTVWRFRNKFRKFSNDQENHLKDVHKSFEAIAVVECMSFIENPLQISDEVALFIKLSVILHPQYQLMRYYWK